MTKRVLREPTIQAKGHAAVHGTMTPVRVVLHDTEGHDARGISDAKGVYNFWRDQKLGYGSHLVIDKEGNTAKGAKFTDLLFHVQNYNTGSIGIEQIGFASFTSLIWKRHRVKQLIKVARWLAWLHHEYHIPLVHSIDRGVCTHADVGKAGIDNSGHTDPGKGYPLRMVLWLANRYVKKGGWSKDQPV